MAKKKSKTYVALVLDKSGSMNSIRTEALQAFNEQLNTIKAMQTKTMDVFVGLTEFGSYAKSMKLVGKADQVSPLTLDDYIPDGMTAMYDGVMMAVTDLEKAAAGCKPTDDVAFLVCIVSDGHENASKITSATLAEKLQALQASGKWTITYLGANQDLTKISETLSIPKGNTQVFTANADGMLFGSTMQVSSLASYACARGVGIQSVSGFYSATEPKDNK